MKQITVISGKGGTGKTSLVGAFAALAQNAVLADCDVDAANLYLLVCDDQTGARSEPFMGGSKASVDRKLCTGCGWCVDVCRFGALRMDESVGLETGNKAHVDTISCEGCGTCSDGCPETAIKLHGHLSGELLETGSRFGPLVHARLEPGEGSSGKLVTKVRSRAKAIAEANGSELVLIDGSPGIGCPVIASMTGVDGVLIVTEPTVSGVSDLKRVLDLCLHFDVPAHVLVNKCDLNEEKTQEICEICKKRLIPVLGALKFDPVFVEAMVAGKTLIEISNNSTSMKIRQIWLELLRFLRRDTSEIADAPASAG